MKEEYKLILKQIHFDLSEKVMNVRSAAIVHLYEEENLARNNNKGGHVLLRNGLDVITSANKKDKKVFIVY